MLLDFATNPRGTTYAYFVCSGSASKRTTCTRRAVPVQVAERLVADSYASITISKDVYRHLAAEVDAAFDKRGAGRDQEFADIKHRLREHDEHHIGGRASLRDASGQVGRLKRHSAAISKPTDGIALRDGCYTASSGTRTERYTASSGTRTERYAASSGNGGLVAHRGKTGL